MTALLTAPATIEDALFGDGQVQVVEEGVGPDDGSCFCICGCGDSATRVNNNSTDSVTALALDGPMQ